MKIEPQFFKVSAPARADLAGGTLDIWPLYCWIGGAKTLNVALDLFATARVEAIAHPRFQIEIEPQKDKPLILHGPISLGDAKELGPMYRFPVAVVSRYLERFSQLPPLRVRVVLDTMVPPQSGLGGSSALCIAIARAMGRLFGEFIEQGWQWKLMEWARDAEASFLGMITGTQDYLASLFGGASCFTSQVGGISRTAYSSSVLEGLAERTLVLFSGQMHDSGVSNWEIIKGATERNADIWKGMETIAEIAEGLDGELQSGNLSWKHIGQYLNEEWRARKSLFQVHTRRLDEIFQFLSTHRILGAKVCGAAAGGSLIVIVDPPHREALAQACAQHGIQVLKTRCTGQGVTTVAVEPSAVPS